MDPQNMIDTTDAKTLTSKDQLSLWVLAHSDFFMHGSDHIALCLELICYHGSWACSNAQC